MDRGTFLEIEYNKFEARLLLASNLLIQVARLAGTFTKSRIVPLE